MEDESLDFALLVNMIHKLENWRKGRRVSSQKNNDCKIGILHGISKIIGRVYHLKKEDDLLTKFKALDLARSAFWQLRDEF
jgi:hypothetical protein